MRHECVRPDPIVVPPPALDDDLGFAQRVEPLAVEELVAQASIEALDVAVLPGTPSPIGGPGTDGRDPFLHGLGRELRARNLQLPHRRYRCRIDAGDRAA